MTLPKIDRNKEIVKRIKKGESFASVGTFYNLARQTVHEIYMRERSRLKKKIVRG